VPDDPTRTSSERADAKRAGQVAVGAAVLGLLAVVGILISVNRDAALETSRGLSLEEGIPATGSGPAPSTAETGAMGAVGEVETEVDPATPAASLAPARGGVISPSAPLGDAGGGDAGMPALEPVIFPASAHLDHPLTPEERYESNAFVLDVLTVRADILREELAAARSGDRPALVRRLERNLAGLEAESERLAIRGRAMERELGLAGTSGGDTPE
jgi:hypothetical protein